MGESAWLRLAGAEGEEHSLMGEACWEREGEGLCGGGADGFTNLSAENLSGLGLGLGLCAKQHISNNLFTRFIR